MASVAIILAIGFRPWYTLFSPLGSGNRSLSTAQKPSMACVSASLPESAVAFGGQLTVNIGSTIANAGRRNGLRQDTLIWLAVSVKTAAAETSEPVPAVVGMQISGFTGPGMRQSPV